MIRFALRAFALVAVVSSAPVLSAQQTAAPKHDATGTWKYTVVTDNGTGEPLVKLVAKDGRLTGTYASRMLGDRPLEGYVKGDSVVFVLKGATAEAPDLTYKGVFVDANNLKGVVDFGGMGGATFTAKREE